jgi:pilus assembly protein Flp/PilA
MPFQAIALQCFIRRPLRRDTGATAVEYALLLTLITLAIVFAVTALGVGVSGIFSDAEAGLP